MLCASSVTYATSSCIAAFLRIALVCCIVKLFKTSFPIFTILSLICMLPSRLMVPDSMIPLTGNPYPSLSSPRVIPEAKEYVFFTVLDKRSYSLSPTSPVMSFSIPLSKNPQIFRSTMQKARRTLCVVRKV